MYACVFCLFEGGCCKQQVVWLSVVGSKLQATGYVAIDGGFQVASGRASLVGG